MKVNLACGSVFVEGDDWENLDFSPAGPAVRRANLLARLPLAEGSADAVYSSHFLEHIPREEVPGFLRECRRLLRAGGILRLVTPDLENICRTYLAARDAGEDEKADFVVLVLVDQCVRRRTGGLLGQELRRLRSGANGVELMREFAVKRFGPEMLVPHRPASAVPKTGGGGRERQLSPSACAGGCGVSSSISGPGRCLPRSARRMCPLPRWASATTGSGTSLRSAPSWRQPVSRRLSVATIGRGKVCVSF